MLSFLFQDPIQNTTLHLIVKSSEVPLGCDNFSEKNFFSDNLQSFEEYYCSVILLKNVTQRDLSYGFSHDQGLCVWSRKLAKVSIVFIVITSFSLYQGYVPSV